MKTFSLIFSAVVCSFLLGCGGSGVPDVAIPELGKVAGTVTLNGAPLADAVVVFEPPAITPDGRESRATTDASGKYELVYFEDHKGAVIGSHTVRITKLGASEESVVPSKYNSDSKLTKEVQAGENTIDLELTVP